MSAFVWLWISLAAWIVLDLILAALWSCHRRRENRIRRDVEADRTARTRTTFAQIVAVEYPAIPTQRSQEDPK
jgi:heme/copper-type cytochrome/quinol oxidase subunit 2